METRTSTHTFTPASSVSSGKILAVLLGVAFGATPFLSSCGSDSSTSPNPGATDTAKSDTAKDTTKVDTTKKDTGISTGTLPVFKERRDTLFLAAGSKTGTVVRYVVLNASSGSTYNIQVFPRKTFQMRVIAARPDSSPQVTDPLQGDSLVFPCTRSGTYLVRVAGPANVRAELRLGSNAILPMYWVGTDAYEYDGDMAHATRIDSISGSQAHTSEFAGTPDIDWIRFGTDSGWTYTLGAQGTATQLPELGRPDVRFFTPDSQPLLVRGVGAGLYSIASFKRQKVYVRMAGDDRGTAPYSVSVTGKAGIPATALPPDAYEPDDSAGAAKSIALDTAGQSRTLHGDSLAADVDWIALAADSITTYTILVDAEFQPDLEVRTSDGIRLSCPLSRDSGGTRTYIFPNTKPGRKFLKVSGTRATSYRIRVSSKAGVPAWTPAPDSLEPDDSPARAVSIPSGTVVYNRNLTQGDQDWFKVTADSGTLWTGTVTTTDRTSSAVGFTLQTFDPAWSVSTHADAGYIGRHSHYFSRRETIYLALARADTAVSIPYTLTSRTAPGLDAYEPDNDSAHAWDIPLDGTVRRRTVETDDTDWIRFRAKVGQVVHVRVGSIGGSIQQQWRDDQGGGGSSSDSLDYIAKKDATVWIMVRGGFDTTSRSYDVRAWSETDHRDTLEPDGTLASARSIPNDSTWVERDIRSGDDDFMTVAMPPNWLCTIRQKGLWNSDHSQEGDYSVDLLPSLASTRSLPWRYGDPFTYYSRGGTTLVLHVSAGSSLQREVVYQVSAACRLAPDSLEPDDGIGSAVTWPYDSTARRRLLVPRDQDWIRLPAAPGKERYIQVLGGKSIDLYRPDSTRYSRSLTVVSTSADQGTVYRVGALSDGELFARLAFDANDDNYSDPVPYTLRAWTRADPDPFEGYDTPSTAPILGASPLVRWITKGDTDLFRLHLDALHAARLVTTGPFGWSLLTPQGVACLGCVAGGGVIRSDTAVDYLVRATTSVDSGCYLRYTVELLPLPFDTGARHRTRATAVALLADSSVFSGTSSYFDTVWYKVQLHPGQNVAIHAASMGQRISLFTQAAIRRRDTVDLLEDVFLAGSDTVVYVGVAPRTDTLLISPVEFRVSNPLTDSYEPDNSLLQASSIDSGEVQQRTIVVGDTDIVHLPSGPTGKYWLFSVSGRSCMAVEVLDSTGRAMGYNNSFDGGSSGISLFGPTGPSYSLRLIGTTCSWNPHIGGGRYTLQIKAK